MAQTNPSNQENGLLPTSTSASPAQLNDENANQSGGKSFIDGQSGLIHGETQNSAGGDFDAPNGSSSRYDHPVPIKHGKEAVILAPDILSLQGTQSVLSVASAQQDARIGYTGPNVGSNGVGNVAVVSTVYVNRVANTEPGGTLSESHLITSVPSYLTSTVSGASGTIEESHSITAVSTYLRSTVSGLAITESDSITTLNYKTFSGIATVTLGNPAITITNVYSGATTASGTFPALGIGASGAGWVQSGTSLLFENAGFTTFSGAATANAIPASGANFWVNYTYNSTAYPELSGTVSVALGNTPVTIVQVYSGATTASGTYPLLGSGVNGAGWSQSGGNLVFSNGSYFDFNAAIVGKQVPASGNNFWVDYTYNSTSYPLYSGSVQVALNNSNVINIFNVYSGNALASGTYPASVGGSAGWYSSNQNLYFTNGSGINFNAITNGQVPTSGSLFWVDYSYPSTSGVTFGTTSFTGRGNDLQPLYIPNVGGRFAR